MPGFRHRARYIRHLPSHIRHRLGYVEHPEEWAWSSPVELSAIEE